MNDHINASQKAVSGTSPVEGDHYARGSTSASGISLDFPQHPFVWLKVAEVCDRRVQEQLQRIPLVCSHRREAEDIEFSGRMRIEGELGRLGRV